eukprot:1141239-Pelagomonas_calceolata.AAC.1
MHPVKHFADAGGCKGKPCFSETHAHCSGTSLQACAFRLQEWDGVMGSLHASFLLQICAFRLQGCNGVVGSLHAKMQACIAP